MELSNQTFIGPFAKEIQDFISLKHSVGYAYESEERRLKQFDRFLLQNHPDATSLTKNIVVKWCTKTPNEKDSNRNLRASVIRQFALYLNDVGKSAWIVPKGFYSGGSKYIPYIYNPDEVRRFLHAVDQCHVNSEAPYRHLIMPIFFGLLLSCGLRCSEARLLKVSDFDVDNGTLTIFDSKNHNSRLIPIPKSLICRLIDYMEKVHPTRQAGRYLFPALNEKPMTLGNVYKNFRKFLWQAGISHSGHGPRVHDFRHTYCVYRLKIWTEQGRNLLALIPLLRTYLGHSTFRETAYYLRLTADVFSDIREKLQQIYSSLIPELEVKDEETK